MAKAGGIFKLDAICAKLKTNLETRVGSDTNDSDNSDELTYNRVGAWEESNDAGEMDAEDGHQGVTDLGLITQASRNFVFTISKLEEEENNNEKRNRDGEGVTDCQQPNLDLPAVEEVDPGHDLDPTCLHEDSMEQSRLPSPQENGGRKSRRKNQRPRNIAQFEDAREELSQEEIEQYEMNNKSLSFNANPTEGEEDTVHYGAYEEDENEHQLLSMRYANEHGYDGEGTESEDEGNYQYYQKSRSQTFLEHSLEDSGTRELSAAMDLSVSRSVGSDTAGGEHDSQLSYLDSAYSIAEAENSDSNKGSFDDPEDDEPEEVEDLSLNAAMMIARKAPESHAGKGPDVPRSLNQPCATGADENTIKDYAESTMNELLSMYGYQEDGRREVITDRVPLKNFASGSILEQHTAAVAASRKPAVATGLKTPVKRPLAEKTVKSEPSSPSSRPASSGQRSFAAVASSLPMKSAEALSHLSKLTSQGKSSATNSFATSAAYIKACFDPSLTPKVAGGGGRVGSGGKPLLPDYSKYLKRYHSFEDCGGNHCKDMVYKEHFHCLDCSFRVFVKKEEMIRHFKWHKKRDESLQHGFLRYSPMDDCSKQFGTCTHNGRQTHYHCLQNGCSKVYISTSDVQMHANYHRKDSAILQEGFQRFRATEDCGTTLCSFYGQRTTHFHCRRPGCRFTFKNKADMEKHKTYHQKDEVLAKDGFKKFMKYENCQYAKCRYSKSSNHIHCIRPGCDYVLHSTGQLYSHKRKHERRDFEQAYKRFRDEQTLPTAQIPPQLMLARHVAKASPTAVPRPSPTRIRPPSLTIKKEKEYVDLEELVRMNQAEASFPQSSSQVEASSLVDSTSLMPTDLSIRSRSAVTTPRSSLSGSPTRSTPIKLSISSPNFPLDDADDVGYKPQASTLAKLASKLSGQSLGDSLSLPIPKYESDPEGTDPMLSSSASGAGTCNSTRASPQIGLSPEGFVPKVSPPVNEKRERDETWKKYLTRYTANDPCHSRCQFLYKDHYHCTIQGCGMLFRSKDGVREHAKHHEQQDRITAMSYMTYEEDVPCLQGCQFYKGERHFHCLWSDCHQVISVKDPVFSRLEHHKIHEYARTSIGRKISPISITTTAIPSMHQDSFKRRRGRPPKYPKNEIPVVPKIDMTETEIMEEAKRAGPSSSLWSGFEMFESGEACPDDQCLYFMKEHFHCVRPRCHHATDRADVLNLHAKDFHSYINILEGFEFFERHVNCRRTHCNNNRTNRHFHCVRSKCDYSFVRVSTMAQHDRKHKLAEMAGGHATGHHISIPRHSATAAGSMAVGLLKVPQVKAARMSCPTRPSATMPASPKSIIKAAGTYFPLSTLPKPSLVAGVSAMSGLIQVATTPSVMVSVAPGGAQPTALIANTALAQSSGMSTGLVLAPINAASQAMSTMVSLATSSGGVLQASLSAPTMTATASAAHTLMQHHATPLVTIAPKPAPQEILPAPLTAAHERGPRGAKPPGLPLTVLLQQKHANCLPQMDWLTMKMKMHYGMLQNCGRPFCKLKKKDHYHCFVCNQAFSDPCRLKSHVMKHGIKLDKGDGGEHPGAMATPMEYLSSSALSHLVPGMQPLDMDNDDDDDDDDNDDDEEGDEEEEEEDDEEADDGHYGGPGNDSEDDSEDGLSLTSPAGVSTLSFSHAVLAEAQLPGRPVPSETLQDCGMAMDLSMSGKNCLKPVESKTQTYANFSQAEPGEEGDSCESNNGKSDLVMDEYYRQVCLDGRQLDSMGLPTVTTHGDGLIMSPVNLSLSGATAQSDKSRRSGRKRTAPRHEDFVDSDAVVVKARKVMSPRSSSSSSKPDDMAPEGYSKFRYNDDCGFERCAYRLSLTHYHCAKRDCSYSFCDRSRFTQHSERHKRLEGIMGEMFQQYRSNGDCDHADCEFSMKSSHFHCLKCPFICTDSSKVTAHRKHHNKMDNISAQGFTKFTGAEPCSKAACSYSGKQTHYHCTQVDCTQVALGPAQMNAHRIKHQNTTKP